MKRFLLFALLLFVAFPAYGRDWVDGKLFDNFEILQHDGISAPSISPSNSSRLYYDSTDDKLKLSEDGGAYSNILTVLSLSAIPSNLIPATDYTYDIGEISTPLRWHDIYVDRIELNTLEDTTNRVNVADTGDVRYIGYDQFIVDTYDERAFVVEKDGTNDDIFLVDTVTPVVTLFGGTDVPDSAGGNTFVIWRKAAEFDRALELSVDSEGDGKITASGDKLLLGPSSTDVFEFDTEGGNTDLTLKFLSRTGHIKGSVSAAGHDDGFDVNISGGNASENNGNGANLNLTGGAGFGTGVSGSVFVGGHWSDVFEDMNLRMSNNKINNEFLSRSFGTDYKDENKQTDTLAAGENQIHSFIFAKGYIFAGTNTSPAKFIRFNDLDDLTDNVTTTFIADNDHNEAESTVYDPTQDKIYILFGRSGFVNVTEYDPDTRAHSEKIDSNTEDAGASGSITSDGTYLYIITRTSPAKILKYDFATFSLDDSATLTGFDNGHSIQYDGTNLYATGSSSPGWVAKINPSDLSFSTQAFAAGDNTATDDFAMAGDYLFVGVEATNGIVLRIKKSDLSLERIYTGVTSSCFVTFFDGRYVWAGYNTTPGTLVRIDPGTLEITEEVMATGENSINEVISDGQRLFMTCWLSPAKVIRKSMFDFAGGSYRWADTAGATKLLLDTSGNLTAAGIGDFGKLVVDTTTLVVNAASYLNKVGIGTAMPYTLLDIGATTNNVFPLTIRGDIDNDGGYTGIAFNFESGTSTYRKAVIMVEGTSGNILPNMHFLLNSDDNPNNATKADARLSILNNGNVGIGVTDPDTTLEILDTTTQLKLSYDASNYFTFTTQSDGDLTLDSNKASYTFDLGDGIVQTTGPIYIDSYSSVIGFGTGSPSSPDGYIYHNGADLIIKGNNVTASEGIRLDSNVGIKQVPGSDINLKILMGAADDKAIEIDGITNDFTAAFTGSMFRMRRDINWGTSAAQNFVGQTSDIEFIAGTDMTISANKTWRLVDWDIANNGKVTNTTANNRSVTIRAFDMRVADAGTWDTDGAGQLNLTRYSIVATTAHSATYLDTGTQGPSNTVTTRGLTFNMDILPTVTSGDWTFDTAGIYLDLVGNAQGDSINRAIHIAACRSADENYAIYDQSGANWIIDSNVAVIGFGASGPATPDSSIGGDADSFNIKTNLVTATDNFEVQTNQFVLFDQDSSDKTFFSVNDDGELTIMPDARNVFIGDGTDGDNALGFWGDTTIWTFTHDDDNGTLRLSANDVTNNILLAADGSPTFVGTAGLLFGHMYIVDPGFTVVIGVATPIEVEDAGEDGWSIGQLNTVTFPTGGTEHYLTVPKIGRYKVTWHMSLHTAIGGGTLVHGGVMVNNAAIRDAGEGHDTVSNSTDTIELGSTTIVDITSLAGTNAQISLWVADGNSTNLVIEHGNMVVEMLGGT